MLKHLAHSHHKLHTFDDFYNENTSTKPIKSRLSSNDLLSSSPQIPTTTTTTTTNLDCSPLNNQYTFYNIFSDLKSTTTPNVAIQEEDEGEDEMKLDEHESIPTTPVFYLEDDHHNHSHSSSSSVSPHWPSLIFNRFRHSTSQQQQQQQQQPVVKQNSVNENNSHSTKMRKNEFSDLSMNKRRFLKRSETVAHSVTFNEKKTSPNDDFPQLVSSSTNRQIEKKHRSFASLFHHFHHNSTGSLQTTVNSTTKSENVRPRLSKQRTLPSTSELSSPPVKKSPSTPILPKLASLFTRHHSSEHRKYRIGNLKARLHHRRKSPQLNNNTPKFQCQVSTELIQEVEQLDSQEIYSQRPIKPVIMKRVHTWHNTFDLRPLDQCLEY